MKRTIAIALMLFALPLLGQSTDPAPDPDPAQTPAEPAAEDESDSPEGVDSGTNLENVEPGEVYRNFIDLGLQSVDLDNRSSKFFEYRDVPNGLTGPSLSISTLTAGSQFRLSAESLSEDDREANFYAWTPLVRASIFYNQTPHRFGFDARSILTRTSRSSYEIADTTQRQFQTTLESVPRSSINFAFLRAMVEPALNAASRFDVELRRDAGGLTLDLFPEARVDTRVTYFQENRNGTRGAGTSFGFSNVVETPEPIEYRTQEAGVSVELPVGNGLVRGGLRINEFDNAILSYTFDNPFRLLDSTDANAYQAPGNASVNGPVFGRISLPPDNRAMNANAGFLYRFPMNTRVSLDVGLGRWTQDEQFIPYTTNSAITQAFSGGVPVALPAQSLDGEINTTSLNFQVVTKPVKNVTFTGKYRSYDLDNDTPRITIPGYARFDSSWNASARISVPYGWSTERFELVGSWDISRFGFEAGVRRDIVERTFRETEETEDDVWRVAADLRATSWMILRASYENGRRRFDEYDFARSEDASFVVHPAAPLNLPQLRRFDQANRDSQRAGVLLQLTPLDVLTVSIHGNRYWENYNDHSDYGLLDWKTDSVSAEVDYSPLERLSLFAFATFDRVHGFQRGRQSAGTISTSSLDDWEAHNDDEADTYGIGANFSLIPDRLTLEVGGRYQQVDGIAGLYSPPGGTPDFAVSIPILDDTELLSASVELDYEFNDTWGLGLGAWLEDYEFRDAPTSNSQPYMPGGFFLAENNGDYRGNVFYARAMYKF